MFNKVQMSKPSRNNFDLRHERKFSCNMGELVPILCEEVVPGDSFKCNTETLVRLAPMAAPLMHRVNVYVHFFFVPNRLIWDNWETFITGGESGQEEPVKPYIRTTTKAHLKHGTLPDYLGFPTIPDEYGLFDNPVDMDALPFRAYWKIYNEYYREQNLEEEVDFGMDDGNYAFIGYQNIAHRCWEKDYFTSALPWLQRGGEVSIPVLGNANVIYNDDYTKKPTFWAAATGDPLTTTDKIETTGNTGEVKGDITSTKLVYDPMGTLEADLAGATGVSINDLREAVKLQRFLEKNARGGSRYIEIIRSHFGVTSSDSRLQRPEYLGGGKSPIVISEVLQTNETTNDSPQGNMAGHGIGVGNTHSFKKYFEEHGFVMGIMSVMPRSEYTNVMRKYHMRNDRLDYYWPEFAQLGEQEVIQKELNWVPDGALNETVFGYQSRYAEYKTVPSTVHGEFKDTLLHWHMARAFGSTPNLNKEFVTCNPTHRIFADTDIEEPKLYVQVYNNLKAKRPMPYFNNPSII